MIVYSMIVGNSDRIRFRKGFMKWKSYCSDMVAYTMVVGSSDIIRFRKGFDE